MARRNASGNLEHIDIVRDQIDILDAVHLGRPLFDVVHRVLPFASTSFTASCLPL